MKRTKVIKLRLTETEHRALKGLAGKKTVSAFLRQQALGVDVATDQTERLRLIGEIARVRNLLVYIGRLSAVRPPLQQIAIASQLVTVERALLRLTP
jgi:hypothetical protein